MLLRRLRLRCQKSSGRQTVRTNFICTRILVHLRLCSSFSAKGWHFFYSELLSMILSLNLSLLSQVKCTVALVDVVRVFEFFAWVLSHMRNLHRVLCLKRADSMCQITLLKPQLFLGFDFGCVYLATVDWRHSVMLHLFSIFLKILFFSLFIWIRRKSNRSVQVLIQIAFFAKICFEFI